MISLQTVEKYCQEYWLIENYDQAMADESQTWHCHHRHEIDWALPMEELIAIGRYYDVHYSELIFLTPEEHNKLHHKGKYHTEEAKQRMSNAKKGKPKSEEWKQKMRDVLKGNKHHKGKHHTEETKQKIRDARKGREGENAPNYKHHITEEELYDLYVVQGFTQKQIAELYNCSIYCIWYKLKKLLKIS